jgi:nicotinamidase-related amidase
MRAALIVIDLQQGFDAIAASGVARNNPQAEGNIARLLAVARDNDIAVFHIRHSSREAGSVFAPDAPGYKVMDFAAERAGEVVIVKRVNSGFIGTNLEARLRDGGYERLFICGATTNHCVETTTRMAGNLGFETALIGDACWTFERQGPEGQSHSAEAIHAMTLGNLNGEFARIMGTDQALVEWAAA